MKDLIVYVHGKGGSAGEAAYYKMLFPNREVIGFDYRSQTPWKAKKEFLAFFTPFCAGGVAAAERVSVQAFCKLLWHDHTLPYIIMFSYNLCSDKNFIIFFTVLQ